MIQKFLLPDVGEGLTEAEIVTWHVAQGDEVRVNDILVEIETAKSIVELPSPYAGTVARLLVAEGEEVAVGTVIVEITDDAPAPSPDAQPEPDDRPAPTLVGYGATDQPARRRRRARAGNGTGVREAVAASYHRHSPGRGAEEVHPAEPVDAQPKGDPLPDAGEPPTESALVLLEDDTPRAKPPVRKYARELGVDLRSVAGTGPDGTITRRDVEAAHACQAGPSEGRVMPDDALGTRGAGPDVADFDPFEGGAERRVPIKGVRKVTADNMVKSVNTHVHVTEWVTIDVTATMEFVERLRARREFAGLRISALLIYAKAICLALSRNPDLNASWDDETQEIVYHRDVNLGIAAATPRGLMVPNIKRAGERSLLELCQDINRLVQISRDGKLQPADYTGGTFTLTNVGVFGIDAGTPIINGDESAILCMGAIDRRPWVVGSGADERVEPRWVTTVAVAFDHRLIDGEQGSRFLADVAEVLSDPATALLF